MINMYLNIRLIRFLVLICFGFECHSQPNPVFLSSSFYWEKKPQNVNKVGYGVFKSRRANVYSVTPTIDRPEHGISSSISSTGDLIGSPIIISNVSDKHTNAVMPKPPFARWWLSCEHVYIHHHKNQNTRWNILWFSMQMTRKRWRRQWFWLPVEY